MSEKLNEEIEQIVDPKNLLNELENLDFANAGDLDIEKFYSCVENEDRNKDLIKSLEAEYNIEKLGPKYLSEKSAEEIKSTIKSIEDLITIYDVEKDKIKGMKSTEIDKVYAIVRHFNLKLSKSINTMSFNLKLTRDEYKFIVNAFKNSLSYNGNDVLIFDDLKNVLDDWENIESTLPKTIESFIVEIDIKNIVVMYQFLAKHEVKGISKSFYTFTNIINYIKEANDLFNAFNIIKERVNSKFLVWAGATNALTDIDVDVEITE